MTTCLGIVGSRYFNCERGAFAIFDKYLADNGIPDSIVSGGAKGVDTLAMRFAKSRGIEFVAFNPDRAKFGAGCYAKRNAQIVAASTSLLALPCEKSKGTYMTINMAKRKGIPVDVINV